MGYCCKGFERFCCETDNVIMGHAKINDVLTVTTFSEHYTIRFNYCPFCGGKLVDVENE